MIHIICSVAKAYHSTVVHFQFPRGGERKESPEPVSHRVNVATPARD